MVRYRLHIWNKTSAHVLSQKYITDENFFVFNRQPRRSNVSQSFISLLSPSLGLFVSFLPSFFFLPSLINSCLFTPCLHAWCWFFMSEVLNCSMPLLILITFWLICLYSFQPFYFVVLKRDPSLLYRVLVLFIMSTSYMKPPLRCDRLKADLELTGSILTIGYSFFKNYCLINIIYLSFFLFPHLSDDKFSKRKISLSRSPDVYFELSNLEAFRVLLL